MPVTYDRSSFLINGERVFLTSGSMHPFRVPCALWRDRLEKARNAGLNTIQFYVAWNWHEPEPGQFDFEGERDLDHFMTLAVDLGFYLVARPGPYICAEWEFGGFPPWLMQVAGIQLRHYDALYLRYVDRYFAQVLPLIAKHQIDRPELQARRNGAPGGVIMVQAENELNLVSPGDAQPYMRHLIDLYRRLGITVPIITCEGGISDTIECVNSHTPADRFARYRKMQPNAPLHCTEFWSGWYGTWDRPDTLSQRTPAQVERETWRILAHGGAGYNYYMWHGGTNFGYTTMYLNTTSYDYGAPLGEAGGLWDKHHRCRRVSLFAQTFADILTTAHPGDFSDMERDLTLGVHFFQRVSTQGNIVFIENPRPERIGVYLYINGISQDLFVAGESVRPVVYNVPIGNDGEGLLALCTAGVLGRWTSEKVTQLVVYGEPGVTNRAIVALHVPASAAPKIEGDLTATWRETERPLNELPAHAAYYPNHSHDPDNPDAVEGESLPPHLKAMDAPYAALADDDAEETLIERASQTQATPEPAYAPGGMLTFTIAFGDVPQIAAFVVNGHTYRLLALPTGLADRTWWAEEGKREKGRGNSGGGAERSAIGATQEHSASSLFPLPSSLFIGANTAQTSANGVLRLGLREEDERLWRYENGVLEGVSSPSTVALPDPPALTNWAYCDGAIESLPTYDDSWAEGMYAPTNRVLLDAQPGYAWYRTSFDSAGERTATLTFTAFADRLLMYLNGEWIADTAPPAEERVADPSLTVSVKLKAGRNVLAVLTDNLGHVKGEWQFRGRPMAQDKKGLFGDVLLDFSTKLHNWRFLPGLTLERGPEGKSRQADVVFQPQKFLAIDAWNWQPAQAMQTIPASKRLRWYRATFSLSPKELAFAGRELLLDLTGLHKGVLWVNGTNLGRYWTTNGHTRAYVPKCWLANTNTLLVFEETNAEPFGTRLVWDDRANIAAWKEVE